MAINSFTALTARLDDMWRESARIKDFKIKMLHEDPSDDVKSELAQEWEKAVDRMALHDDEAGALRIGQNVFTGLDRRLSAFIRHSIREREGGKKPHFLRLIEQMEAARIEEIDPDGMKRIRDLRQNLEAAIAAESKSCGKFKARVDAYLQLSAAINEIREKLAEAIRQREAERKAADTARKEEQRRKNEERRLAARKVTIDKARNIFSNRAIAN